MLDRMAHFLVSAYFLRGEEGGWISWYADVARRDAQYVNLPGVERIREMQQ